MMRQDKRTCAAPPSRVHKDIAMTEKLFYQDPHLFEFTATVRSSTPEKGNFAVVLDRTAFYPEGGGQLTDLGELDGIPVVFVKEVDGEIRHYCTAPFEAGQRVTGRVDKERRLDLMQQHSGEHIASGLICTHFNCENVGFHISDDFVTIDYNVPITWDELKVVEDEANRAVRENKAVHIWVPSKEELAALEYRSKKELEGDVRIVEYPGVDICACCGTHVTYTGEVGLIKFVSLQSHRGGVRIEMLIGKRAFEYVRSLCEENKSISVQLSAKETATAAAVARLKKEAAQMHERLAALETEAIERKAAELAGKGNVLLSETGMSVDSVRRLCSAVTETCGGFCGVLSDCGEDGVRYAFGQEGGDLRALTKAVNEAFSGRGGGKPFFTQGTLHGEIGKIEKFLREQNNDPPA